MSKLRSKLPKTSQLGPTTWTVTLKSVWKAVGNWCTRRLTDFVRFPYFVWTIILFKKRSGNWENGQTLPPRLIVLGCLYLARIRRQLFTLDSELLGQISTKEDPNVRVTTGSSRKFHSSHIQPRTVTFAQNK